MAEKYCKRCRAKGKQPKDCIISAEGWQEHIAIYHKEELEQEAITTITKTTEQVDYIYTKFGCAEKNDGWLIEKVLQYFPFMGARAIYDSNTGNVELIAKADKFSKVMKHTGSITRIGRMWRAKHPNGVMDEKQAERNAQADWSRGFWYGESHGAGV
jgi:hypothetical protein